MGGSARGLKSDTLLIFTVKCGCATGTEKNHKELSKGSRYLKQDLPDISKIASHSTTTSCVYLLYSGGLMKGYRTQIVRATKQYL